MYYVLSYKVYHQLIFSKADVNMYMNMLVNF